LFSTLSGITISVPKFGPGKFRSLNISPAFQHFSGMKFRSSTSVSKWPYFHCFLHFSKPLISVPNFGPQKFRSRISVPKISVPNFGRHFGAISAHFRRHFGAPLTTLKFQARRKQISVPKFRSSPYPPPPTLHALAIHPLLSTSPSTSHPRRHAPSVRPFANELVVVIPIVILIS
jgi:hypothetical protein